MLTNPRVQPHRDCPTHQIFDEETLQFTSQPRFPSTSPSCSFMGPIDPTIEFGPTCLLDASTKKHILFIKLSAFLSSPAKCRAQPKGVRYFHVATLFPLHDESYMRQHPFLKKPNGPLSHPNQLLGGRAKFVGFLDKSMLTSYPDETAYIPILIPEDFNFFPLSTPAAYSPPVPATPARQSRNGAAVAGPVWRRVPPSNPSPSPPTPTLRQPWTPSGPASGALQPSSPSNTLGIPSTPSRLPSGSPSSQPAAVMVPSATGKSNRDLHHPRRPFD